MSADLLDQLYERIQMTEEGSLVLDPLVLDIPNMQELLQETLGIKRIVLYPPPGDPEGAACSLVDNLLRVKGDTSLLGLPKMTIQLKFYVEAGEIEFTLDPLTEELDQKFVNIQQNLFQGGFIIPSSLSDFTFSSYGFTFQPKTEKVVFHAETQQDLHFGGDSVFLRNPSLRVTGSKLVSGPKEIVAEMDATAIINKIEITVHGFLGADYVLQGELPAIDLDELLGALPCPPLKVPTGFPHVSIPVSALEIRLVSDAVIFVVSVTWPEYGSLILMVQKIHGNWEYAVVFMLPADWQFARLTKVLEPLDKELVIKEVKLILASFEKRGFVFPRVSSQQVVVDLQQGASVVGQLELKGAILCLLSDLIHMNSLPLATKFGDQITNAKVSANWDKDIVVFKDILTFHGVTLNIGLPLWIGLTTEALIVIKNPLPRLKVSGQFLDGRMEFSITTEDPWTEPCGIKGLTIRELVVKLSTPPFEFDIKAVILLRKNKKFDVICAFDIEPVVTPRLFIGSFTGELSLQETVEDLVGLSIPVDIIPMSLKDPAIYVVPYPIEIGGVKYQPGLALESTLEFFGLETANIKIKIDKDSGLYAHGSLSHPINFANILVIDAPADSPDNAPYVTLVTTGSPFLKLEARFSLLDLISDSVTATIDKHGIVGRISQRMNAVEYDLTCTVKSLTDFSVQGTFRFRIHQSTPAIQIIPDTPSFTILIDLGFKCTVVGAMSLADGFIELTVSCTFSFFEVDFTVGFKMKIQADSIDKIRKQVQDEAVEAIIKKLGQVTSDLFKNLFETAEKFLRAINLKFVEIGQDAAAVAQILLSKYNSSNTEIGTAIRNVLNWRGEQAAIGLKSINASADDIAQVLNSLGDDGQDIGDWLKGLHFGDKDIGKALKGINKNAKYIARLFKKWGFKASDAKILLLDVGFSLSDVIEAIKEVFA